jgi:beta-glucosidase
MTFPEDFTWGVATSSYQIEGAVNEDGRTPSIWDTFSATAGKVFNGDTGAIACDHYHRWREDLDLLTNLGVDGYRFSTSWSRILPQGYGQVNSPGLDFYDQLVDGLLARGIKPFLTLYHWDLPQVLEDVGGWRNPDISDIFCEYAHVVAERLGERVHAYATMNEPWCIAALGHEIGEHAPGYRDRNLALLSAHNVLLAHGKALPVLRESAASSQLGIVLNFTPTYPASDKEDDIDAAYLLDGWLNRWYLDPLMSGQYPQDMWEGYGDDVPEVGSQDMAIISRPLDFLGVNYYTRAITAYDPTLPFPSAKLPSAGELSSGQLDDDATFTAMGWEVYPEGLYDLLTRLGAVDNMPAIFITENGAAFADVLEPSSADVTVEDSARVAYFEQHLDAVHRAMQAGVNVRGYFAWSFLDNFEWSFGYHKRFGLYYLDYPTQTRIPKTSAHWYREFLNR